MNTEIRSRPKIFLVYSSDRIAGSKDSSVESAFNRAWSQLELFPTTSPETLLFVTPDDGDFLETLRGAHAKHIFDLRDVPYLTLGGMDRRSFFHSLDSMFVDYASVHALLHDAGSSSVLAYLTDQMGSNRSGRLEHAMLATLKSGPTVVLCDRSPSVDTKVGALLDFLSKKQVKHSPVLAVH
jgi:hypothetical protein